MYSTDIAVLQLNDDLQEESSTDKDWCVFENEPLYQIYHSGVIAREVWENRNGISADDEDDAGLLPFLWIFVMHYFVLLLILQFSCLFVIYDEVLFHNFPLVPHLYILNTKIQMPFNLYYMFK